MKRQSWRDSEDNSKLVWKKHAEPLSGHWTNHLQLTEEIPTTTIANGQCPPAVLKGEEEAEVMTVTTAEAIAEVTQNQMTEIGDAAAAVVAAAEVVIQAAVAAAAVAAAGTMEAVRIEIIAVQEAAIQAAAATTHHGQAEAAAAE